MLKASKHETDLKMRFPIFYKVRSQKDYLVDRLEVEAWQHVELTSTNRSRI